MPFEREKKSRFTPIWLAEIENISENLNIQFRLEMKATVKEKIGWIRRKKSGLPNDFFLPTHYILRYLVRPVTRYSVLGRNDGAGLG